MNRPSIFATALFLFIPMTGCIVDDLDLGNGDTSGASEDDGNESPGQDDDSAQGSNTDGGKTTQDGSGEIVEDGSPDQGDLDEGSSDGPNTVAGTFDPACLTMDLFDVYDDTSLGVGCPQGGRIVYGNPDSPTCLACTCNVNCSQDSDCLQPETGNVQPSCEDSGRCVFRCDETTECPEGTACIDFEGEPICMLVEQGGLECGALVGDDPCAAIVDEAECNATISDHSLLRCLWAEEQLFADDGNIAACTPSRTEGRCLLARELLGSELERSCGSSACDPGASDYWEEIGGGTFGLIESVPCELSPRTPSELRGCGIEGATDPLLCECGPSFTCE